MWAPSAGNIQPWRFVLVRDKKKMEDIEKAAFQQEWLSSASFLLVVCADVSKSQRHYGVRGERLYIVQDCAAAIENMLLEATSQGVASCWVGAFDEDAVKRALEIPDSARPQAIIAFGYPSGETVPMPSKKEIHGVLFFEKYGEAEDKRKKIFPITGHLDRAKSSVKEKLERIKSKLLQKQ